MSNIKIGALVDGRYRINARIGHGGMAEVYEATDIINKRKVAIKMIREDVMANPINLRRFQNEATIASSLSHPNIVKVYNHGTIEGRPYIANEYISFEVAEEFSANNKFSVTEWFGKRQQVFQAADSFGLQIIACQIIDPAQE